MVSLRLISHPKEEAAMYAQARVNGATGEGNISKVSDY